MQQEIRCNFLCVLWCYVTLGDVIFHVVFNSLVVGYVKWLKMALSNIHMPLVFQNAECLALIT